MVRRSRCAAVAVALAALLAGGAVPPAAADPKADLRARAAMLRRSLTEVDAQLDAAMTSFHRAEDALTLAVGANLEAAERARDAADARETADDAAATRIRALYMNGGQLAVVATVLQATDVHDAISRYRNASAIMTADRDRIDEANDGARDAERTQQALRDAARAQVKAERAARGAAAKLESLLARQASLLASTDAQLRALIEAEARRARELAAAALAAATAHSTGPVYVATQGTYACPVGATRSFVDTWLAPRSGGREHQGTDVFAPYGSPAYAVTNGVIDQWGNGGLGGITLWLRGDNGDRYYYAHNSVNLAPVGTRVRAGDVIARVGDTGNAKTTPPHIHFEAHPGGGTAQNPYPFLKAACSR